MFYKKIRDKIYKYSGVVGDKVLANYTNPSQTVVIFGFWRSGTTWLQEMLAQLIGARTLFEPLTYYTKEAEPFLRQLPGVENKRGYPYIRPTKEKNVTNYKYRRNIEKFLLEVLKGEISNIRTNRSTPRTAVFQEKLVVKMTYGNLLAAFIEQRFGCPTIFLVRHPCAVVASILRNGWGRSWVTETNFLDLFLDQSDLVEDYLGGYIDIINYYKGNAVNNVALTYAITHFVPFKQKEIGLLNSLVVNYENLVTKNENTLEKISEYLYPYGYRIEKGSIQNQFKRASSTTQKGRKNASDINRLKGWKRELTKEQIDQIFEIIEIFEDLKNKVA